MTFARFEELLHIKHPQASACAHGRFGGTERNNKVEINFKPCGKCYEYYGSYQDVLNRLGIYCLYQSDVRAMEKRLDDLKDRNGKPNPFSLFNEKPCDLSKEIEECEEWLEKAKTAIMID